MPEPYVSSPKTITVCIAPSENAQNITVPFADYIKNVASSEIYLTWPEQASVRTCTRRSPYVLNRVFTEWYRAQAAATSTSPIPPATTSLVPGRDIENISTIVDDMIGTFITRGDSIEPLFTQYCNGTTVTPSRRTEPVGNRAAGRAGTFRRADLCSRFTAATSISRSPVHRSPNLGGSFPGAHCGWRLFRGCPHTVQTSASTAFRPIFRTS